MPEFLPRVDVRQMHLHRRDVHRLQRVQDSDARVRIGRRVNDDPVYVVEIGLLNRIDNSAFVIRLEAFDLHALRLRRRFDKAQQLHKGLRAIDVRFPDPQKVEVWPVDDQKFHNPNSSLICCAVCRTPWQAKRRSLHAR